MRADLITRLRGAAPIASIIGTRSYWGKRKPNDPVPAIVIHKITPGNAYTFDGRTGLYGALIQFDCLGQEVRDFDPLATALKAELEQVAVVGGTNFRMSFLRTERDMDFVDVLGIGPVGGISMGFDLWWKSLS